MTMYRIELRGKTIGIILSGYDESYTCHIGTSRQIVGCNAAWVYRTESTWQASKRSSSAPSASTNAG